MNFLRAVSRVFVDNIPDSSCGFEDYTFVFPNRRSSKFFQRYIGQEYGRVHHKPLFSPECVTISDLFTSLSGYEEADPLESLFLLYSSYISLKYPDKLLHEVQSIDSFDDFYKWGSIIIKDFNDVDTYLVDPEQIFANIRELKELDGDFSFLSESQRNAVKLFWSNFLNGEINEKKEIFGSLWNIMPNLYKRFCNLLSERGKGYSGMIYRGVAERIMNEGYEFVSAVKPRTLVFIGFNSPNKCEQTLMRYAKKFGKADFYWDFYGPAVTDPLNKASVFISDFVKEFPSKYVIDCESEQETKDKNFYSIGVPSGMGQAMVLNKILNNLYSDILPSDDAIENLAISTAVVLPDERMLMPVINAVPSVFQKINVTMGYPMRITSLFSFLELVYKLQRDIKKGNSFYHTGAVELLSHEYITISAKEEAARMKDGIISGNMIFIDKDDPIIGNIESPLLKKLFAVARTTDELYDYLVDILNILEDFLPEREREFIYMYYQLINRLRTLNLPFSLSVCFKILSSAASQTTIPFNGEPLAGLQIMGPLETRSLDFENIIILSANEGVFPAANASQSLVPYNLRYGFGLPTYEVADTIGAYHFYRSIYRAKNIFMIYDTRSEGMQSGEMSRYIMQLKYHYGVKFREIKAVFPISSNIGQMETGVIKSASVMEELYRNFIYDTKERRSLSATALNTYIDCPLKFYIEYVIGLKREEEVMESVEANTFGDLFHLAMKNSYTPFEGKVVNADDIKKIMDNSSIENCIAGAFEKKMKINEISGQNVIVKEVLKKYLYWAFREDLKLAPFKFIAGEKVCFSQMRLADGNVVRFKGVIDRVDEVSGYLRISDYKTGKIDKIGGDIDIGMLFESSDNKDIRYLFQLYFYSWMYERRANAGKDFKFCVYPLRKLSGETLQLRDITMQNIDDFEISLKVLVEEIFNPDIPFSCKDRGGKHCSYCDFNKYCNR